MSYGSIGNSKETTQLLAESVALSHSSEEISLLINQKMREQKDYLDNTQSSLGSMRQLTKSASASINEIESKARRRKLWLWIIIVLLFLVDVYIIYRKITASLSYSGVKR